MCRKYHKFCKIRWYLFRCFSIHQIQTLAFRSFFTYEDGYMILAHFSIINMKIYNSFLRYSMILKYYVHPYLIICLPKALANKSSLKSNVFSIFTLAFGEFPFPFLQLDPKGSHLEILGSTFVCCFMGPQQLMFLLCTALS